LVHLNDVLVLELLDSTFSVAGLSINLQVVKSVSELVIVFLQLFNVTFEFTDFHEQLGVSLLSGQELLDHLLDVSNACGSLDGLECFINLA